MYNDESIKWKLNVDLSFFYIIVNLVVFNFWSRSIQTGEGNVECSETDYCCIGRKMFPFVFLMFILARNSIRSDWSMTSAGKKRIKTHQNRRKHNKANYRSVTET